jgi:hypothetical protein
MQADVGRKLDGRTESSGGFATIAPAARTVASSACQRALALLLASLNPIFPGFLGPSQTQGWTRKAHEFIDSGPPVLLNNPCCCRRVVCSSFLKHAMEVHYG